MLKFNLFVKVIVCSMFQQLCLIKYYVSAAYYLPALRKPNSITHLSLISISHEDALDRFHVKFGPLINRYMHKCITAKDP